MLEAEGLQIEGERAVTDLPALGKVKEFPAAAALRAPVVVCIGSFPALQGPLRLPDHLRVRPDEQIIAPALEFFTRGRIQHFIITPLIRNPHNTNLQESSPLPGELSAF